MKHWIWNHKKEIALVGGTVILTVLVCNKLHARSSLGDISQYFTDLESCPDVQGLNEMYLIGFMRDDATRRPWLFNMSIDGGTTDLLDFASMIAG